MWKTIAVFFLVFLLVFHISSYASVSITSPSLNDICVSGSYSSLGDIVIAEGIDGDFQPNIANQTFTLTPSVGDFEFQPGIGTISTNVGGVTSVSMVVSLNSIAVTFSTDGSVMLDQITISGLNIRSTASSSGTIQRNGGTAIIAGFNDGTDCASLSSFSILSGPSDVSVCSGTVTNFNILDDGSSVTYQWQRDNGGGFGDVDGSLDGGVYGGFNSNTLNISDVTGLNNYKYRCVVTGSAGCSTNSIYATLTVNALPDNGLTVSAVSDYVCYNGSTNIQVQGSESGVSYQLRSGTSNVGSPVAGTGGTINLPTGSLTATATFNVVAGNGTTGCSRQLTQTAVVNVNNALSVVASAVQNVICEGGSTVLNAAAVGGSGSYSYSWLPNGDLSGAGTSGPTYTPSGTGPVTFTVTITDANGNYSSCTAQDQVDVQVNALPDNGLTVSAVSDYVCYNGSTNIQVQGSESGVSYQLRSGTSNVGSPVAGTGGTINLPTGALTATATFNVVAGNGTTGCSRQLTQTAVVNVNNALSVVASAVQNVICEGGSTVLNAAAVGGSGSYSYSWLPNGDLSGAGTSGPTYTPSGTGPVTFTVTITDANGNYSSCTAQDQVDVQVNALPDNGLTVSAVSDYVCYNGSTNIQVQGSESGVSYQLRSGTSNVGSPVAGTGGTINLPTGALTATATFNVVAGNGTTGCSRQLTQTAVVNVNNALSVVASAVQNVICEGGSTVLNAAAVGGSGSYSYSWLPNGDLSGAGTSGPTYTPSGTGPVTFTVTITDANGNYSSCTAQDQVDVQVNALPDNGLTVSAVSDYVCYNGSTNIQVQGSESGVSYQLRSGTSNVGSPVAGTGGTINLPTGALTATATFNVVAGNGTTGCSRQLTQTAVVNVNNALSVVASAVQNVICEGGSTVLNAAAVGGSGSYSYSWLPNGDLSGAGTSGPTYTPSGTGPVTFTVTITDANGNYSSCTAQDQVDVQVNALPDNGLTVSAVSDYVCYNGSTNIQVQGSESGVSYQLRSGTSNVGSPVAGTGGTINLPTGSLTATATFNVVAGNGTTGCSRQLTQTAVVNVNNALSVVASAVQNVICEGGSTVLNAAAVGGSGSYSYSWLPNGDLSGAGTSGPTYTPSGTGPVTFTVTITDANGNYSSCTAQDQVDVQVNALPDNGLTVSAVSDYVCYNGSTNIQVQGSESGVSYQLRSGTSNVGSPVAGTGGTINLPTGSLTATATFNVVAGNGTTGCSRQLTQTAVVNVNNALSVVASSSDNTICVGSNTTLIANATGGSGSYLYSWIPNADLTNDNDANATYTASSSGNVTFTVTVTDNDPNYGLCSVQDQVDISSSPLPDLLATPASETICSLSTTNVSLSTPNGVNPVSYTWVVQSNPGGIVGASSGSGNSINQYLTNSSDNIQILTYRVSPTSGAGCVGNTLDINITVNPGVKETIANNDGTLCSGTATDIDYSTATENGDITLTAAYPAGVTGSVNYTGQSIGSTGTISETLTNTNATPQTVTYTFTASGNGCGVSVQNVDVVVNPSPDLTNLPGNTTICSGAQLSFTPVSSVGGVIFNWTSSTSGNITGNTNGTGTIDDILTNTGDNIETVTYTVTTQGPGPEFCAGAVGDYTVTVNPGVKETIANNDGTLCSGTATDIDYSTATENGDITLTAAYPAGVTGSVNYTGQSIGSTGTISETLTNTNATPQTVTYTFTASGNGCGVSVQNVDVVVNPSPDLTNLPGNTTICSGAQLSFTPVSSVGGVIFNWTSTTSGNITGNTNGTGTIDDILTNTGDNIETVTYTVTTQGPGPEFCAGAVGDYTVTVNPGVKETIANNDGTLCSGTATDIDYSTATENGDITLTAAYPSGVTGSVNYTGQSIGSTGTISETLTNTNATPQTVTYTFTASGNGCGVSVQNVDVVVNPLPTISVNAPDVCSGSNTDIQIFNPNNVPFTTFNWHVIFNGPNIIGASDGTGDHIVQLLTNTNTIVDSMIYRINTTALGCKGDSVDVKQIVNPGNLVYAGADQVTCEGTGSILIGDASIGGGASFPPSHWSIINGSGSLDQTDIINPTYTPAVGEIGTITLKLTAADASVCPDVVDYVDLVINREAFVNAGIDKIICEGESVSMVDAFITGGTDSVAWTGGSGSFLPNNYTVNAIYQPDPSEYGHDVVLRMQGFPVTGSPCGPVEDFVTVHINLSPIVNAGTDKIICEGDSTLLDDATFSGGTNSIQWTGGNGYFYPNNTTLNAYYVPAVSEIGTTVTLTLTSDDPAGPCGPTSSIVHVTINKAPEANAGTDKISCEGSTVLMADATIGGSATSVTWSGGTGTFTPNAATLNTIYTPDASETSSVVKLWLTTNDPVGPCVAVADTMLLTVNQAPTVYAGVDKVICEGDSADLGDATMGGSTISVTWSGGSGSFSPNANTLNAYYKPVPSEIGTTIILTLTSDDPAGPCLPVSSTVKVTINKAPEANAGVDKISCEGSTVLMADATIGGSATAVTWSRRGGTFTPNATTLNTIYTPNASETSNVVKLWLTTNDPVGPCVAVADTMLLTVNQAPTVYAGVDKVICEGDSADLGDATMGGSTISVTWSGGSGSFSPNATTLNAYYKPAPSEIGTTIILTLTSDDPSGPCVPVSSTVKVTINKAPEANAGTDKISCEGSTVLMADATIGGSATAVTWSGGAGTFTPNATTLNTIYTPNASETSNVVKLWLTTNDPVGPCVAVADTMLLTVNQAPTVYAGVDKVICEGDSADLGDATMGGSTISVTWSGGSGSFSPNANTLNAYYKPAPSEIGTTIILTLTSDDPSGPCVPVSSTVKVTINKAPEVLAGADKVTCEGSTVLMADATIGGSATAVTWSGGSGTFTPNATTLNTIYAPDVSEIGSIVKLWLTTNDPVGPCAAVADTVLIAVNQAPVIFAGVDKTICEGDIINLSDATQGGSVNTVTWSGGLGTFLPNVNTLNPQYIPAASEIGTTVTLTITSDDPIGPCSAVTDQVNIIINRVPTVNAGADRVICETSTVALNGVIGGSATSATWTTTGDGAFSFNGDLNATYTPGPNDKASGLVTLTLTTNDPSGPCTAVSDDMELSINQQAISIPGSYSPICFKDSIYLSGQITGSATSAYWVGGSGTFINPMQLDAVYVPAANEEGKTVTLSLITDDPSGPCPVDVENTSIVVHALPDPTFFGLDNAYQIDDPPSALTGVPLGGIFSGPGISGNSFDPSISGDGIHTITYTYTNANSCSDSYSKQTIVYALPIVNPDVPQYLCDNQDKRLLPTDPSAIDKWSGPNVSYEDISGDTAYYYNAKGAGVGSHVIQYRFTDDNGVTVIKDVTMVVNASPVADFVALNNCISDTIQFQDKSTLLNGLPGDGITQWEWNISTSEGNVTYDYQNPKHKFLNYGNKVVSLTVTTKNKCTNAYNKPPLAKSIKIGAVPEANFVVRKCSIWRQY